MGRGCPSPNRSVPTQAHSVRGKSAPREQRDAARGPLDVEQTAAEKGQRLGGAQFAQAAPAEFVGACGSAA